MKNFQGTVNPGDTTGDMERAGDEELLPDPGGVLTFKDATISTNREWTSCTMSECCKKKHEQKNINQSKIDSGLSGIRNTFMLDYSILVITLTNLP